MALSTHRSRTSPDLRVPLQRPAKRTSGAAADAPPTETLELRTTRKAFIVFCVTLPLLLAMVGFALQQRSAPTFPTPPVEATVRGRLLAADGTILADGPADDRHYPQGRLAGSLLGFTGSVQPDGRFGLEGLEYSLDARLQAGTDVRITLDPTLQAAAETNLAAAVEANQAANGSAVILQVGTGRILAAASYPSYDPNAWRSADREQMLNRPFLQEYEPGSVMKPFVIAALMQSGKLSPDEMIDTPHSLRVGDKTFRDVAWHDPQLSVPDVLRYSSNTGMIHLSWRFTPQELHDWLGRYGFGHDLAMSNVFTRSGLLNDWRNWVPQDQASNTIGQNISVTPLQLAAAYSILANDGVYVPPRLIDDDALPAPHRVLAPEIAQAVRSMLIHVVEDGVPLAKIPGITVAGKTGTADIFDRATGSYPQDDYALSFAGMFPAERPSVVLIVTMQKPRVNTSSTYVAAPLFSAIGTEVVAHWGLAPSGIALATGQ